MEQNESQEYVLTERPLVTDVSISQPVVAWVPVYGTFMDIVYLTVGNGTSSVTCAVPTDVMQRVAKDYLEN